MKQKYLSPDVNVEYLSSVDVLQNSIVDSDEGWGPLQPLGASFD